MVAFVALVPVALCMFSATKHLLKVYTTSSENTVAVESVVYSTDMTLGALRASTPPKSPLKWAAFCAKPGFGSSLPFINRYADYEADDLHPVTRYYSPDSEIQAKYVFIKDGKEMLAMPVCTGTTFRQLRDRLAHRLGTREFEFKMTRVDEEVTLVSDYVTLESLHRLTTGARLIAQFHHDNERVDVEKIRSRAIHIERKGSGYARRDDMGPGFFQGLFDRFGDYGTKKEKELEPQLVNCAVPLDDETIIVVPMVDLKKTRVRDLRQMVKARMSEKQVAAELNTKTAICSPIDDSELDEDDLLGKHVKVLANDTVILNHNHMTIVDWPNGSDKAVSVSVCTRSTIVQLIKRAAPSFGKLKSERLYGVLGGGSLLNTVPVEYQSSSKQAAINSNKPLHLRHVDSIFLNVQDGHGHRMVMVADNTHRYAVTRVYERFAELLGAEHGWSLAICDPEHKELSITSSLRKHDMARDGEQLDAMVVRVKATVEDKKRTTSLLMNVCGLTSITELKARIASAVGVDLATNTITFLNKRMGNQQADDQVDLFLYRARPPTHPRLPLYVWISPKGAPFFTLSRDNPNDGLQSSINVIYTLPDETVFCLNRIDPRMSVRALKLEFEKRTGVKDLLFCSPSLHLLPSAHGKPLLGTEKVGDTFGLGDNYVTPSWVTIDDLADDRVDREPKVCTVCPGETYRQVITRCSPSFARLKDAEEYEIGDGSALSAIIDKEYLADDCSPYSAKPLVLTSRNEHLYKIKSGDGQLITVLLDKRESRVKDVRSAVARKYGTATAWGVAFCRPSMSWERVFKGAGCLSEDRDLASLSKNGVIDADVEERITVLARVPSKGKDQVSVLRVPVNVCTSGEQGFSEVKNRILFAMGYGLDTHQVICLEDPKHPVFKYIYKLLRRHQVWHMDVIKRTISGDTVTLNTVEDTATLKPSPVINHDNKQTMAPLVNEIEKDDQKSHDSVKKQPLNKKLLLLLLALLIVLVGAVGVNWISWK